jgi:hypothetical protein
MIARLTAVGILAPVFALFAGCSTSELQSSWKSPSFARAPFTKVMVIGLAKRPEIRKMYEDTFAQQLQAAGKQCVTSYALLPDVEKITREAVVQAVKQSGADAVLITRLAKTEQITFSSGTAESSELVHEYYQTAWPNTYTPKDDNVINAVVLESKLFDAASAKVVWSGVTQSLDPQARVQQSVGELVALIVKKLAAAKML